MGGCEGGSKQSPKQHARVVGRPTRTPGHPVYAYPLVLMLVPCPCRWDQAESDPAGFHRFMRLLINFRRATPALQRTAYVTERDVQWHGEVGARGAEGCGVQERGQE